jgi:hypothetical protein
LPLAMLKIAPHSVSKRNVAIYWGASKFLHSNGAYHKGESFLIFCNTVIYDNINAACIGPQFVYYRPQMYQGRTVYVVVRL